MKKIFIISILTYVMIYASCKTKNESINTNKPIEFSLNYILKNFSLPKEYYNQPLQIIQSEKIKIDSNITVNNYKVVLLPNNTNPFDIINKMNIYEPIPIVEIFNIKIEKKAIQLDIIFRATGHNFLVKLTRNGDKYKLLSVSDRTI